MAHVHNDRTCECQYKVFLSPDDMDRLRDMMRKAAGKSPTKADLRIMNELSKVSAYDLSCEIGEGE